MAAEGLDKEVALRHGGFSDEEILEWKSNTAQELMDAGFGEPEVKEYFGVQEPDMAPMREYFKKNLESYRAAKAEKAASGGATKDGLPLAQPQHADTFWEGLVAGWQMSVPGLVSRGKLPDTVVPEHAPMLARIGSMISSTAGDVPAMIAGALGGAIAGAPTGGTIGAAAGSMAGPHGLIAGAGVGAGVGAMVGAGAGGNALPAARAPAR
jgi:hypothetical protein